MHKKRLLLVDDHQILRAGLRALFGRQEDIEVVGEAASVNEAILLTSRLAPDIVLLDLKLSGGGGMAVLQHLKSATKPPRVLILSMHDDIAYVKTALASGASGYVVKTISEQTLLSAVRAVARGQLFVDLDNVVLTSRVFGPEGPSVAPAQQLETVKLSPREKEILRLLGQGHTNVAIAELLELSAKTVATYRARIGEKIGLKTTADFVRYATDNGLISDEPR